MANRAAPVARRTPREEDVVSACWTPTGGTGNGAQWPSQRVQANRCRNKAHWKVDGDFRRRGESERRSRPIAEGERCEARERVQREADGKDEERIEQARDDGDERDGPVRMRSRTARYSSHRMRTGA